MSLSRRDMDRDRVGQIVRGPGLPPSGWLADAYFSIRQPNTPPANLPG